MSDHRFGQRHFSTRDRLRVLMRGIDRLARETATPIAPALPLLGDEPTQDHPLCFAVFGEINTGKSSLLNALVGHPLCPVSELPRPIQPICHYRHGAQSDSDDNGIQQCRRPLEILRSLEVIDTPGIRAESAGPPAALLPLLDRCELIICLLPITNPWSALTWDFLVALPAALLAKTVLVIQQSDRVKAIDLEVMIGHVLDLAGKKLNQVPPVFAVSAKLAIERGSQDQESGLPKFRAHVESRIEALAERRAMLDAWLRDCARGL
ncbi:MAG TPA: dynamin family protein, partial [Luteolibacter sp.]|nr:dynamin family protein [Luteolibacter sp.]